MASTTGRDRVTRERLLEEATRLFAERGFRKVTVRDICHRARANVAAINYHFGGKTGLYDEVLEKTIRVMQGTTTEAQRAGRGRAPEEQLVAFISIFLQRVFEGRDSSIHQLMMRELSDPTPALDLVIDRVIRPRIEYLSRVIAAILGCRVSDPRVWHCVLSVQSQCLAVRDNPIARKLGFERLTERQFQAMAEHIAKFSIAGIRAVRDSADTRRRPRHPAASYGSAASGNAAAFRRA